MISSQPAIPLLVHEDCMDGIKTDLASQQASLSRIESNTEATNDKLNLIETSMYTIEAAAQEAATNTAPIDKIESYTYSIKTSSSNTATATSSLYSSVGTTADASSSNTVIGLLKSIANKL